ncbi:trypsin beta-like [Eurosta solidaginis]|uniref:trypsin beta-like n=1 Tax=Eurosta solidaginis TaxID=178769 RepID=UPI003530EDA8
MYLRNYFALLVSIFSCSLTYTSSEFRIVGGSPWTIQQSPYLVSIRHMNKHHCVGSLVSLDKVLTAASCVEEKHQSQFVILAGVTKLSDIFSAGKTRSVARVIIPDLYNSKTKDMDIALMRLCSPFDKSNTIDTIPICGDVLKGKTLMQISGWGWTTPNNGITSNILQATNLTTETRRTCANHYKVTGKRITTSMICAAAKKSDACNEDAGGPGVVNKKLYAVVSHNLGCSQSEYPTVFTALSNIRVQRFLNDESVQMALC